MGMFDYVKCNRILPDGFDGNGVEFQTKDHDCEMNTLEITEDGLLVLHDCEWGVLPPKAIDFHGFLSFYKYEGQGQWREYEAKFTDGKLVEIKAHASRLTPEVSDAKDQRCSSHKE